MNFDKWHLKTYHDTEYNCSHFVRELYHELTGWDIADLVGAWNSGELESAMRVRTGLIRLECPQEPCIALFQRAGDPPHIGVFIQGKIFHMTTEGPRFQPLDTVCQQFERHKFYTCRT